MFCSAVAFRCSPLFLALRLSEDYGKYHVHHCSDWRDEPKKSLVALGCCLNSAHLSGLFFQTLFAARLLSAIYPSQRCGYRNLRYKSARDDQDTDQEDVLARTQLPSSLAPIGVVAGPIRRRSLGAVRPDGAHPGQRVSGTIGKGVRGSRQCRRPGHFGRSCGRKVQGTATM